MKALVTVRMVTSEKSRLTFERVDKDIKLASLSKNNLDTPIQSYGFDVPCCTRQRKAIYIIINGVIKFGNGEKVEVWLRNG